MYTFVVLIINHCTVYLNSLFVDLSIRVQAN